MLIGGFQAGKRTEHLRHHQEDEECQEDIRYDERKLERHELQRAAVDPQFGEHDGLKSVQPDDNGHAPDILGLVGISHRPGNRTDQCKHGRDEQKGNGSYHLERRTIHPARVFSVLVGKAEQGGLHAEGQDCQQQSRISIQIGDNAVAAAGGSNLIGINRYQQIVQEPPDYAAEAVYSGVFS